MSILRLEVIFIGLAYFLHWVHIYKMAIPALDVSTPLFSRHQVTFHTFLRIASFHHIVKEHIEIVCLHIRSEEHFKIVLSTIGTLAVFKKQKGPAPPPQPGE